MTPARRRLVGSLLAASGALVLWAGPPHVAAADQADTVARVKPAVVVVGTFQATRNPRFRFRGTGFAVGDGTLVATNAHVIPTILNTEQREVVTVLVRANGQQLKQYEATPVATDPDHDLALLRVKGPPLTPLQLGDSERVREGEMYLLTGFPIGEILGAFPVTHRAMVAAIAPVAIPSGRAAKLNPQLMRRLQSGAYQIFQLDGTAYPGNSGSPLYDARTGAVVGMLNMVFVKGTKESALEDPSGISYAIPARFLADLLRRVQQ
jgi:S1-C subfamily serine protease